MLAEFLLGPLRAKILSTILLQPDQPWHVREIARHLNALPGSINRELLRLAEVGILVRHNIGNQAHYRPNPACPILDELAAMLRKTSGVASEIAAALQPLAARIQSACIFGSVARGEDTGYSDVDVLVLGSVSFDDVVAALYPVQQALGRDINPAVYSPAGFLAKLASGNAWAHEVVRNPKLFVMGADDDFGKLVKGPAIAGTQT
jgi:predicted nucleotidyltransferase